MKKLFPVIFLMLGLCFVPMGLVSVGGCTATQQKRTVNTMATIGEGVNSSYMAYLDLVVSGKLATNSVPQVSKSYGLFQDAFRAGVEFVAGNTNSAPPQSVLDAAAGFNNTVTAAKKGTPL